MEKSTISFSQQPCDTLPISKTEMTPKSWKGVNGKSSLPPECPYLPEEVQRSHEGSRKKIKLRVACVPQVHGLSLQPPY